VGGGANNGAIVKCLCSFEPEFLVVDELFVETRMDVSKWLANNFLAKARGSRLEPAPS
jgi:hypothetical protein